MISRTIILADGKFPEHEIPLGYLKNAERIICCDGSVKNLINAGYQPDAIVGDLDSLNNDLADKFRDRLFYDDNHDTNDLTKAVEWCRRMGYTNIVILGATGKREDHTIGNISLLAEYKQEIDVIMVTDTGILRPYLESCEVFSFKGQQVSIFSLDPQSEISSCGLKYGLLKKKVSNWWVATLNESLGENFSLEFKSGPVIVYLKFME
jgi:thiamine pyrophosphokinase